MGQRRSSGFNGIDRRRGSGDQFYATSLFSVRSDGEELRQLVQLSHPFVTRDSSRALQPLSWDHTLLHVDQKGQIYVRHSDGSGTEVLTRWDGVARAPMREPFVSTPGFDYRGTLVEDRDSGELLGVHVLTDAWSTHWFDPSMRRLQALVDERLPGVVNQLNCRRCTQPDRVVLVHSQGPREPGRWFVLRGQEPKWIEIGRARKEIDPAAAADVSFHRIQARDGRELPVWLTIPPGRRPGQGGPAVVLAHGGPWVRGGEWAWEPMAQFLASRGYLVINPEFRGSTGYGAAHFRAGWRQWGRAMQDDVADAVRWAVGQGWADGKRVCIAGASYGGYATLMGLVRDPQLYRCGAAWVAVTDPLLIFKPLWNSDLSDDVRVHGLPVLIGDPDKDAAMYREVSPVVQASRITAPLLLAFGQDDRRVPIDHGEKLRDALREAGRAHEYVVYDGEAHSWFRTRTKVDFALRLEKFLAQHLAP